MNKKIIIFCFLFILVGLSVVFALIYTPPLNIRAADHSLIKDLNNNYHIFYTYYNLSIGNGGWSYDPNADFFGHTTSLELTNWTDQPNVINVGSNGAWDSKNVWAPYVFEYNGIYYLFYTGVNYSTNNPGANVQQIGIATSSDLFNWTKHVGNPVWNCSMASWAEWYPGQSWKAQCRDPMVYFDSQNNRFIMYYMARLNGTNKQVVGTATSTNLIAWKDSGYIQATYGGKAESPFLTKKRGIYYLFWNSYYGEAYATSNNPLTGFTYKGLVQDSPVTRGLAAEIPHIGNTYYYTTYGNTPELYKKIEIRKVQWNLNGTFNFAEPDECDVYECWY
ncbi:MAG TPA: family 43 glycosylhydrolase [Candidatus Nanoarchaeia archaeon]|nr:family 43 glycosylhydrolase [Candidatus Nanoarchaeia archaeon]